MTKTVTLSTSVDQQILENFRSFVFKKYGYKKGNLKIALEESMKLSMSKKEEK